MSQTEAGAAANWFASQVPESLKGNDKNPISILQNALRIHAEQRAQERDSGRPRTNQGAGKPASS